MKGPDELSDAGGLRTFQDTVENSEVGHLLYWFPHTWLNCRCAMKFYSMKIAQPGYRSNKRGEGGEKKDVVF